MNQVPAVVGELVACPFCGKVPELKWHGCGTPGMEDCGYVIHMASPGPNRKIDRSRTFHGIADAMGDQWGGVAEQLEKAA